MYCSNCGTQNRANVNFCENCGAQLRAVPPARQAAPPVQPIIVQTRSLGGGLFSGCAGIINWLLAITTLGLIGVMVLSFLCIIRLPADLPLIDPPRTLQDIWSRAVVWQGQSCSSRVEPVQRSVPAQSQPQQPAQAQPAQPAQQAEPAKSADKKKPANQTPRDATVIVNPMVGEKCQLFIVDFSGFSPGEIVFFEVSYLDNPSLYTFRDQMTADGNGKTSYAWNGNVLYPGQYILRAWTDYEEGSAVFIVEGDNTAACNCLKADTESSCTSNGGNWQVLRMQTGPNQYLCNCPNQ